MSFDSDQGHHDGHDHKWHHRVHHNANWTTVGGTCGRMSISHMNQGQQHQHKKAHGNRHLQGAWPWTVTVSPVCQNRCQPNSLNKMVHRNGVWGKTLCMDHPTVSGQESEQNRFAGRSVSSLDPVDSSSGEGLFETDSWPLVDNYSPAESGHSCLSVDDRGDGKARLT